MRNFLRHIVSYWHFGPSWVGLWGLGGKMREMLFLKVTYVNACRA